MSPHTCLCVRPLNLLPTLLATDHRADDLVAKLTPSLPSGFTRDRQLFVKQLAAAETAFVPLGEKIETYSKTVDGKERHFEIYESLLEANEPAQTLLAKLQTLSLWFIEGRKTLYSGSWSLPSKSSH